MVYILSSNLNPLTLEITYFSDVLYNDELLDTIELTKVKPLKSYSEHIVDYEITENSITILQDDVGDTDSLNKYLSYAVRLPEDLVPYVHSVIHHDAKKRGYKNYVLMSELDNEFDEIELNENEPKVFSFFPFS